MSVRPLRNREEGRWSLCCGLVRETATTAMIRPSKCRARTFTFDCDLCRRGWANLWMSKSQTRRVERAGKNCCSLECVTVVQTNVQLSDLPQKRGALLGRAELVGPSPSVRAEKAHSAPIGVKAESCLAMSFALLRTRSAWTVFDIGSLPSKSRPNPALKGLEIHSCLIF
jgi:hypothetical protein